MKLNLISHDDVKFNSYELFRLLEIYLIASISSTYRSRFLNKKREKKTGTAIREVFSLFGFFFHFVSIVCSV